MDALSLMLDHPRSIGKHRLVLETSLVVHNQYENYYRIMGKSKEWKKRKEYLKRELRKYEA